MKKAFVFFGVMLCFVFASCADEPYMAAGKIAGGNVQIVLDNNGTSLKGIVVETSQVTNAVISLTGPTGVVQTATWNVGDSKTFLFNADITGAYTLSLTQIDTSNYTASTNVTTDFVAGYNYYITITLGGTVIVSIGTNGTPSSSSSSLSSSSSSQSAGGGTNNYIIFSETTLGTDTFRFDTDGHLYIWNNLTIHLTNDAYEGVNSWDVNSSGTAWWGMGITHETPGPKDLSAYARGSLHFALKTLSQDDFKVGFMNGSTEYWFYLYPYDERFGLIRDGQWHDVSIPFACFGNPVMSSLNQIFMMADSIPDAPFSAKMDNIYYEGKPADMNITNMTTNNYHLLTNVAFGSFANQSSMYSVADYFFYPAGNAIDGGYEFSSMTTADQNAWWETDLGQVRYVHSMKIWDGGSGDTALRNFYIFVSEAPFGSSDLNMTLNQTGVTKYYFSDTAPLTNGFLAGVRGRYVRIQRTETKPLYLAEVAIYDYFISVLKGPKPASLANAASGTAPNQSSMYSLADYFFYPAENAINGGVWGSSPAMTLAESNAWWETDLGGVKDIDSIRLYQGSLKNFYIFVSRTPFLSSDLNMTKTQPEVMKIFITNDAGISKAVNIGAQGRYVRIQRTDNDALTLHEVQILVPPSEITPFPNLSNAALGSTPNQSSVYSIANYLFYPAGNAINGGIWGSPAAMTLAELNAWWETDLGSIRNIDSIRLYQGSLKNFYIFVSQVPFQSHDLNTTLNQSGVMNIFITNEAGISKTVYVGVPGRYVRIQRTGVDSLYLNEVQILVP